MNRRYTVSQIFEKSWRMRESVDTRPSLPQLWEAGPGYEASVATVFASVTVANTDSMCWDQYTHRESRVYCFRFSHCQYSRSVSNGVQ